VYSNAHGRLLTYPQQEIAAGLAAGLLLVGLVVATPAAPLNRIFRLRPIVWVGTISYGLYIYFIPVFIVLDYTFVLHGWKVNYYVFLTISVVCLFAMATLSYYLVEKRFLALKDRLNDRNVRGQPKHARGRSRSTEATASVETTDRWKVPTVVASTAEPTSSALFDQDVPIR
jgi:peptidoglycan/LPS O-acetylase OafA/YrhL